MTSKASVENFLNSKTIAVLGVSRNKNKFGNVIYKELKKKGYQVYPVNPCAQVIEGDACYPDISSLPELPDGVLINVPPEQTEAVVREVQQAGIKKVWMQQGSQSDEAVKFCGDNNIDCVHNECILMFANPAGFIHRAHKWVWGVLGKLPQ